MGIKLVKQGQQTDSNQKPRQQSSATQIMLTAQSWVKEFQERKSRGDLALAALVRQS